MPRTYELFFSVVAIIDTPHAPSFLTILSRSNSLTVTNRMTRIAADSDFWSSIKKPATISQVSRSASRE
jgi:hypothetical protein